LSCLAAGVIAMFVLEQDLLRLNDPDVIIFLLLYELQLGDDKLFHFLRKMCKLPGKSLSDSFLHTMLNAMVPKVHSKYPYHKLGITRKYC